MGLYIIMMGVQGAGKGMQAGIIGEEYGIPQISTGDLFRAMQQREDDLAKQVQAIMKAGDLVPDEVTCQMVADRLTQPDAANGAIFDGFPRNENQAEWLKAHLADKGEQVNKVLLLELDLFTAFKRAFGRISDKETGASYNIYFNADEIKAWRFEDHPEKAYPPQLVAELASGNPAKRRPDDANAHAIVRRIDTFLEQTAPLIAYYEGQDLVTRINANQGIGEVSAEIKQVISEAQTQV